MTGSSSLSGSNYMSLALQNRCGLLKPCFSFVTIKAQAWRLKIREHGTPKGRLGEGRDWASKQRMLRLASRIQQMDA